MVRAPKYTKNIATRFPPAVFEAVQKLVKDKQNKFPRYTESDLIRFSVVSKLKRKGYLENDKHYL